MYDILTTCAGNGTCACVGVKVMYKEENRNLGKIFQRHYGLMYLEYLNLYQNGKYFKIILSESLNRKLNKYYNYIKHFSYFQS